MIVILVILMLLFVYILVQRHYNYWMKKKVPHLKPLPIFGNYKDYILLKRNIEFVTEDICKKFEEVAYVGTFFGMQPTLVVKDPELIKLITTEDFYYFNGREICDYTHKEILTQNLFFTQGDRWKVIRQNLTPLFTSAKMKNMFYLVKKCSLDLERLLEKETKISKEFEVTLLTSRYTIDSISSCGFGVDSNVMGSESDTHKNPFKYISTKIFELNNFRTLMLRARALYPAIFYGLGLKAFNTDPNGFFNTLLSEVFKNRNYKPSERNDYVDLLLNLTKNNEIVGDSIGNMKNDEKKVFRLKLDDTFLVGQSILFFVAGYETSTFTLSFTLYELAKNQMAQQRAAAEVDNYLLRHKGDIDYDCVTELPYVLACADEALRLYPVLGVITREVAEEYTLPNGLNLEKGLRIHIPVRYLHRNPRYFPEPDEFRPERFYGEEKANIKPYIYMPFGVGQRQCIGTRFAKMQLISGLIPILKNYRVELASGMPRDVPLEPRTITTQPYGGIRLLFIPRNK